MKMIIPSIAAVFLAAVASHAQNYSIDGFKIAGGGGTSMGGQYSLNGVIGQPDASAAMAGGGYSLTAGFWSAIVVAPTAGLTVAANNASRAYGAANPVFGASFSGFVHSDTPAVISGAPNLSTAATAASSVGTYPIVAGVGTLSAAGYSFGPFIDGTLTVTPAGLMVTANNANRAYGAANPIFGASFSGFVNGDTPAVVSGGAAFSTTAAVASPVGTYPIVAAVGALSAVNYVFDQFVNGTLTILPNEIRILNSGFQAGMFSLSIPTAVGSTYTLEYKDALSDADWRPGETVLGTGNVLVVHDHAANPAARYYRVRVD